MNIAAENFVNRIINDPNLTFVRSVVNNIETYELRVPVLGGIEFYNNGKLKGFLNP